MVGHRLAIVPTPHENISTKHIGTVEKQAASPTEWKTVMKPVSQMSIGGVGGWSVVVAHSVIQLFFKIAIDIWNGVIYIYVLCIW